MRHTCAGFRSVLGSYARFLAPFFGCNPGRNSQDDGVPYGQKTGLNSGRKVLIRGVFRRISLQENLLPWRHRGTERSIGRISALPRSAGLRPGIPCLWRCSDSRSGDRRSNQPQIVGAARRRAPWPAGGWPRSVHQLALSSAPGCATLSRPCKPALHN